MKLLGKDIKKDFFADGTQQGELKPIIIKNGVIFVPTSDGLKKSSKQVN